MYKNVQAKPHAFARTQFVPNYLTSITGLSYIADSQNVQLSSLPNVSDFTNLFDQYCIDKVEVTYIPRYDNSDISNLSYQLPRIYGVVDHDDAATPTNIDQLMQYANLKSAQFNKPFKVAYVPSVAVQSYGTVLASGFMPKTHQWVDINNSSVAHYGHKVWIDLHSSIWGTGFKVDLLVKYYFKCKNLR